MTTFDVQALQDLVAVHFPPGGPRRIGVAVSGGGDSLALLHLLAARAREDPALQLRAVTVDHRLRPEARDEARQVGAIAQGLDVSHDVLTWESWDGSGNLQAEARRARYDLLKDWALQHQIEEIALGHTADDQAETFLMRLARSSGVDGLSGMQARRPDGGVTYVRPLLEVTRQTLRDYLKALNVVWIDDPSNEDLHYDRVKMRRAMQLLAPLGITARAIGDVTRNLGAARATLGWYAAEEARKHVRFEAGDVLISRSEFCALQPEIARRILLGTLNWVAGAGYPPRRASLALALSAIEDGAGMNLHGCNVAVIADDVRISREYEAVRAVIAPVGNVWDGRWRFVRSADAVAEDGLEIRALGQEGLAECGSWRDCGLPYRSLLGYPSLWRGDTLVAAPHAGLATGWHAELLRGEDVYYTSLLAH